MIAVQAGEKHEFLEDEKLLLFLNSLSLLEKEASQCTISPYATSELDKAKVYAENNLGLLNLPFSYPEVTEHSVFLSP